MRCRSKVNIQRPKPRHDARRLFEAITMPVILPEPIPHTEICARRRAKALEHLKEASPWSYLSLFDVIVNSSQVLSLCWVGSVHCCYCPSCCACCVVCNVCGLLYLFWMYLKTETNNDMVIGQN